MSAVFINVNKLSANYSSSCHFKIKIVLSTSPYKENVQNKHSFKYEKGTFETNMYEKLELKPYIPLNSESKLHFFLEVYTKTGYKTAGVGVYHLSKGVSKNVPIKIEIQKCPLGKGYLEIQFLNFSLKPSISQNRIIPLNKQKSYDKLNTSNHSNNNDKSYISDISIATNITNIEPIFKNHNIDNSPSKNSSDQIITSNHKKKNSNNKYNVSKNNTNNYNSNNTYNNNTYNGNNNYNTNYNNEEIIKQKDRIISELKTKIDYYNVENKELKNLIKDLKKENKAVNDEKNKLIYQEKEKLKGVVKEKEDLQNQNNILQQNIKMLKNNKINSEQNILNVKVQDEKQNKDLIIQIKNLTNIKLQLEKDNNSKDEKIISLNRKLKEMSVNYQKKIDDLNNNHSSENNINILDFNDRLNLKDDHIAKLKIKIQTLEDNIQSLNQIIAINDREKEKKEEATENMPKLLRQISEKDQIIFELRKEVSDLNNKLQTEKNDRKTQNMIKDISEKEYKTKINELQNIINEKENDMVELRTKYEDIKYNSKKAKIHYIEESDEEKDIGNSQLLFDQLKDIQKTYKEREEMLLKEKDEEIKKLRMRNKDLERENGFDNNSNIEVKKYINEINRLKSKNTYLEEDLGYYKELKNKYMDNEKKTMVCESEIIRLQNLLQKKDDEINSMQKKYRELEDENNRLERQLVNSKGKLGEVLNELAEAETKCANLEEKQRQLKESPVNGALKKLGF